MMKVFLKLFTLAIFIFCNVVLCSAQDKPLEGKVIKTDKELKISIGKVEGVKEGMEFEVKENNELICTLKIIKIEDNQSFCEVVDCKKDISSPPNDSIAVQKVNKVETKQVDNPTKDNKSEITSTSQPTNNEPVKKTIAVEICKLKMVTIENKLNFENLESFSVYDENFKVFSNGDDKPIIIKDYIIQNKDNLINKQFICIFNEINKKKDKIISLSDFNVSNLKNNLNEINKLANIDRKIELTELPTSTNQNIDKDIAVYIYDINLTDKSITFLTNYEIDPILQPKKIILTPQIKKVKLLNTRFSKEGLLINKEDKDFFKKGDGPVFAEINNNGNLLSLKDDITKHIEEGEPIDNVITLEDDITDIKNPIKAKILNKNNTSVSEEFFIIKMSGLQIEDEYKPYNEINLEYLKKDNKFSASYIKTKNNKNYISRLYGFYDLILNLEPNEPEIKVGKNYTINAKIEYSCKTCGNIPTLILKPDKLRNCVTDKEDIAVIEEQNGKLPIIKTLIKTGEINLSCEYDFGDTLAIGNLKIIIK